MTPEDEKVVEGVLHQLKINGVFDQFRKSCMSDIDTYVRPCN